MYKSQNTATTQVPINRQLIEEDVVYIPTMAQYSVPTKNGVWPFAATWIELENSILSEVSQTDKDKYSMIQFISAI